jgi:hypothetical protein
MSDFLALYRKHRAESGYTGGPHDPTHHEFRIAPSQLPDGMAAAIRGVNAIIGSNKAENTNRAYSAKLFEFIEYSDYARPQQDEATRYLVTEDNIFDYCWYVAYRQKRGRGKRKRQEGALHIYFSETEFQALQAEHEECARTGTAPPEPLNGVNHDHFVQLKAAIKNLHKEQVDQRVSVPAWDFVWTDKIERLKKMVRERKKRLVSLCLLSPGTSTDLMCHVLLTVQYLFFKNLAFP